MADKKRLVDVMPFMKTGWHLVRTGKSNEHLASMSLADVPTVDAVEVVHGRWIKRVVDISAPYYWKDECSICHWEGANYYLYCPGCGAKMDGDGDG